MPASIQASAYADTEILFDWHKVEGFKGGAIDGIKVIVRGTDGADQTMVAMDLLFATSHIPTPSDDINNSIDVAPATLGTTGAAVDTPGWFNNLVGYVPVLAADFNDGDQYGVGLMQLTTSYGKRCSAVDAFINPIKNNKNLTIKLKSIVTKIIIEKNKAIGIEVLHKGKLNKYYTNNEIILTAGTYISPKLLMLSGIGDEKELSQHNIKTICKLKACNLF